MKIRIRRIAKWAVWGLAALIVVFALHLSVFFLPYPLFPHHLESDGFSVYSDREIPEEFELVLRDARLRVEAIELDRGAANPRIFVCRSRRLFVFLVKLAGKRSAGQGLVISAAGNVFLSEKGIENIRRRTGGRPVHSRLEGSWAAAIAHEVAHLQISSELGHRKSRSIPGWKSEGYSDFSANRAAAESDPDYSFEKRVGLLLDDDSWRPPIEPFDRRHLRWHVLVEYLCTVKGLSFDEVMDVGVTEEGAWRDLMAWYSSLDS
jgi:hypothetical protein